MPARSSPLPTPGICSAALSSTCFEVSSRSVVASWRRVEASSLGARADAASSKTSRAVAVYLSGSASDTATTTTVMMITIAAIIQRLRDSASR